ncbi:MAG: phage portal protein [Acetivibrio ethanolgignens]
MKLFRQRAEPQTLDEAAAEALVAPMRTHITKDEAGNVAAFYSCLTHITEDIAALPIKLYRREGDKVIEIKDDRRVYLLNKDTGDTLSGQQFKRALVKDYYLGKGGYAYINRSGTRVFNTDPIFKEYAIMVNGIRYWPHQFVKILRNTKNGYSGHSIVEECQLQIKVSYEVLKYEVNLVATGGNKKGFLHANKRLSEQVMATLKAAFRRLYSSSNENVVVLNEGITFQEASNTSVEMQMNENKKINADEICKIFKVPPRILSGGETEEDRISYLQNCLVPLIAEIECSLDRDLLLESEKGSYFFAVDTSELTKGDIEKRFKAYAIASKNGFMQTDEIRRRENLPDLNLDFIKLGLQDVLYDVSSKKIFIPNMGKWMNMDGSEVNAAAGVETTGNNKIQEVAPVQQKGENIEN